MKYTNDEFIRVWQTSASATAAAEALGGSYKSVNNRASYLRKRGVPLKKFVTGRFPLNIKALAALARSLAPEA